jgi:hypothetical protein
MINLKNILLVTSLLLSNLIFSQSNKQLHHIKPKWELGDIKNVYTESFTKIYIKDSLFNNTEATANYSIKVIDTIKNYTLLYASEPNSLDIKTNSSVSKVDSVVNIITQIIKNIEKETKSFQYEILVDKNTGQALKIKNSDDFLRMIEHVTSTMIDKFGNKLGKTTNQLDSIKQKVVSYFKLNEPKILGTIINQFDYIMAAYALKFPYNSSISQKAMIHDVNAMGEFGDTEMPAIMTTSSKKSDSSLTIQTDIDYDKDFLLEQIKKKYKNMNDLTTSEIFLSEKTEASFSTKKNWIVSHKSSVVFKTKEVKVINETHISFE